MAIRATCGSCNSTFNARDELAGKRVKCPKCKERMVIPAAPVPAASRAVTVPAAAVDPMEELLNEANIGQISRGPMCPNCAASIVPGSVICVECGFNMETGRKLRTSRGEDEEAGGTGLTDAEKIMRKAEAELDESPVGSEDQDFGDGGDSFVIAGVAGIILAVLVVIGLVIVFSMDQISKYYNSGGISLIASCFMWAGMSIWISFIAFRARFGHGLACVLTGGFYCLIFGFMQGKALIMPTIIMIIALVVGMASGAFVYYCGFEPVVI